MEKKAVIFYLEDTLFEKPQVVGKSTSPKRFRVNHYCQYLNLPTFNQSSQSNQLFLGWLVEFLNLYVDCISLLVYLILYRYNNIHAYIYIYIYI